MSAEKVKEGVFVGPQIRKLIKDAQFLSIKTDVEKKAWLFFAKVISKFLGNSKDSDFKPLLKTCWLVLKHLDVA